MTSKVAMGISASRRSRKTVELRRGKADHDAPRGVANGHLHLVVPESGH